MRLAAYSPRLMERYPIQLLGAIGLRPGRLCSCATTMCPTSYRSQWATTAQESSEQWAIGGPRPLVGPPVSDLAAVRQDLLVHDDCMLQSAARVIKFDEAVDERLVGRILHDSWGNDVSDLVQVPSQRLVEPDGDVGRGFLPADRVGESLE